MKHIFSFLGQIFFLSPIGAYACDVCQDKQPEILKGITHGPGPQGPFDYFIIIISVIIVMVTLYLSIKLMIKPKESAPNHIKNYIVE